MKKMIIVAITVLAVIATVIGCQVYDSQTNEAIYSSMNALGEGSISKEDYMKNFIRDAGIFNDLTADLTSDEVKNAYNTVLGYFLAYPEFYTKIKGIVADDATFKDCTDDSYNNDINNPESVKIWYKDKYMTVAILKALVKAKDATYYTSGKNKGQLKTPADFGSVAVEDYLISDLYEKQYQLKWDWNGKKGR